jgi:hypothetical protein
VKKESTMRTATFFKRLGGRWRLAGLVAAALVVVIVGQAWARTIIVTDAVVDRMACIAEQAPRQSWAAIPEGAGVYTTRLASVAQGRSFLMRWNIGELPKDSRILNAELFVPIDSVSDANARLYLWRLVGDWGPGVSYQYRTGRPKAVEWGAGGAGAPGIDRAVRPTGVIKAAAGEIVFNVTQDVEAWYNGAATNAGWMFTAEDTNVVVNVQAPMYSGAGRWKLRITYEPR